MTHTLASLRRAASSHNRDVRRTHIVKVGQRKSALMSYMQSKRVTMPAPRAPAHKKKSKSKMFKKSKKGTTKVKKSIGVKRALFT